MLDLGSGAGTDSLVAALMVGAAGVGDGDRHDAGDEREGARGAAADAASTHVAFVDGEIEELPFDDGTLRRRDLERRDRPDPGQGRGVLGDLPGAAARRPDPVRRRHDPAPVSEEGKRNIDLWTG